MMSLNASAREAGWKDMQDRKDMFDIRQGFRVAIFGVAPLPLSAEKVWPPPRKDRAPATREQTMKVYEAFLKMLEMDKKTMYREDESEQDPADEDDTPGGMSRVSWKTLLFWVETNGYGLDVRMRCVYEAMFKGLKGGLRKVPEEKRDAGVSLSMLIRWIWPFVSHRRLVDMFTWMCLHELEGIRLAEPPVIPEQERQDITQVYHKMDLDGKGYCKPFDLAGGDHSDWQVQLANTIDEATVKMILGDRAIPLNEFLDRFCEDGYRGTHEFAHAILKDGVHVVKHPRKSVDWAGWVFRDAPPEQENCFRRVDTVEAEVLHWQRLLSRQRVDTAFSTAYGAASPL